jgi:DNA-binding transcriptional regulator YdaS (Cro superfamily)
MKTQDAIEHFGSAAALARAVNITRAAVSQWGELVPLASAVRIEKLTNGALTLDLEAYRQPLRKSA